MKVAFSTQDLASVDAHFGWCPNLVVYEVDAAGARPLARHAFAPAREDGDEDKLAPRVEALAGCTILYTAAIGGSAAGRVRALGVHPARVAEGEPIATLLAKLRDLLAGTPPPWLRKAMSPGQPGAGEVEP